MLLYKTLKIPCFENIPKKPGFYLEQAPWLMTMQLWLMHHFFPQENLHTSLASPILFAHHATNQARSRVSIPFEVCQKCPVQYQDLFLDLEKKIILGM